LDPRDYIAEALGEIVDGLAVGASIDTRAPSFRQIASAFEFFLPTIPRKEWPSWPKESFDGFRFVIARKNGPRSAEFLGLAIFIGVQEWVAIDVCIVFGGKPNVIEKLTFKLGEPGDGIGGLSTLSHRSPAIPGFLAGLPERRDRIQWVFKSEVERP